MLNAETDEKRGSSYRSFSDATKGLLHSPQSTPTSVTLQQIRAGYPILNQPVLNQLPPFVEAEAEAAVRQFPLPKSTLQNTLQSWGKQGKLDYHTTGVEGKF